jgi:ribosomal protein S18 acetylase RimI-like enzyme
MAAIGAEAALPGAAAIERASLSAWPGLEVAWDGAWVRRAARGYTKRANSVQSLDDADDADAEARILAAARWAVDHGVRPAFRLTPLAGPGVVAALDRLGWRAVDASHLFAMPLAPPAADPRGEALDVRDPRFLAAQTQLQGYGPAARDGLAAILNVLAVPAAGIVLHDEAGEAVAAGLMSIADGIVVTGNVIVAAAARRRGHAAAMLRTGLAWAHEQGARVAALNVAAENVGAQALYRSLGYTRQYDYGYRVPGGAA